MTEGDALGIVQQAIWLTIILAGPVIASAMIIGVGVAFFQALTQVQEMTLTFIPKLMVVVMMFLMTGAWMMAVVVEFTRNSLPTGAKAAGVAVETAQSAKAMAVRRKTRGEADMARVPAGTGKRAGTLLSEFRGKSRHRAGGGCDRGPASVVVVDREGMHLHGGRATAAADARHHDARVGPA